MSEMERPTVDSDHTPGGSPVFTPRPEQSGGFPKAAWVVAAVIVVAVILLLVFAGRRKSAPEPTTLQPPAPYAASLQFSGFAMSESENLSGGKMTYLDGRVRNSGNRTVTGATVQVVFANDVQMPPQIDTVPLMLIRTKEPYVDTEPLKAAPLKPGDERDFRLTFDSMPDNWNQQMPEVRVIQTDLQ